MARGMTVEEARVECERWFAYLDRQRTKSLEMQKIAALRRSGEIDLEEARRRQRALDNCSVTVFDGANLEKAVRVLLKATADLTGERG